jgi:hypothetical protein
MNRNKSEVKTFKRPYTVFQEKLNDILVDKPSSDVIKDLIEIQMFKNAEKDEKLLVLVELYNLLGLDKFYEVMDLLAGKTVKFPPKEDFKETIQVALSYYYKNFEGLEWTQIKDKLGDDELQTVKLGIKCTQLKKIMDYVVKTADARAKIRKKGKENE